MWQLSEDLCLLVLLDTANDSIIPIHFVDTVCRLRSSEVWISCWNGFVWTKSHALVKHVLCTVCQALSDPSLCLSACWRAECLVIRPLTETASGTSWMCEKYSILSFHSFTSESHSGCSSLTWGAIACLSWGLCICRKGRDERKAFPSLDEQTSACSDHALPGDQDKKAEAAGISVHQAPLLRSSPQENGNKLVPTVWLISSTTRATIIVIIVPV